MNNLNHFNVHLQKLWTVIADIWTNGVGGVDIGHFLEAVGIFFLFLLIRGLFSNTILDRIHKWAAKTSVEHDDKIVLALTEPIRFIPVVLGVFFALEYLGPKGNFAAMADHLIRTLIAFNIFWALVQLVKPLSFLFKGLEAILTPGMVQWVVKAIKVALVFVGCAAVLETWGIKVGPILAGLGLLGAAVALGAKDMFQNLIAGLLVLGEKRFHPGDWVLVDGVVEGTVEDIGFRSTMIRRFDKAPVYVPNSQLADNALTNFSAMTYRRIYWTIGVEYNTTLEQLKEIRNKIEEFIVNDPDFVSPDEVSTFIRIDKFSASSIDIMVYCFTRSTVWGEWLESKERLAYKIKEIVEGAGSGFAFPSQSVYLESMPFGKPETFVPPGS